MRITSGKGLHLKMDNGLTLSIQIGAGNYCDNYNEPFSLNRPATYKLPPSTTAEIGAWYEDGELMQLASGDTVAGYVPVEVIFSIVPALMGAVDKDAAVAIINAAITEAESGQ